MSSSFPEPGAAGPALGACACIALALLAARTVPAAELWWQPIVSLESELNSNLDLQPPPNTKINGYIGDAEAIMGVSTPTSETIIHPRVDYRDYPSDTQDNRLEEFLDLTSSFRTARSKGGVYMDLQRRDDLFAERDTAFYNYFTPPPPTAPDTGHTVTGAVRTSVLLVPDYSYSVTPLTSLGVSGVYQQFNYSPDNSFDAVNFRYYQARSYLRHDLDQQNDITFGVYASQYEATHIDSQANAGGVSVNFDRSWTPLLTTGIQGSYQRTLINLNEYNGPLVSAFFKDTSNTWGMRVNGQYKGEIQQFRLDAGRIITPSGGGGVYVSEQVRFQYTRQVTPRFTLDTAAIALKNHGLTSNLAGSDRTYYRLGVDLKYLMSRNFFVQGGYEYFWQRFQFQDFSADNNRIYVRFGYQGLGRQY
jgi:hypothetical protein